MKKQKDYPKEKDDVLSFVYVGQSLLLVLACFLYLGIFPEGIAENFKTGWESYLIPAYFFLEGVAFYLRRDDRKTEREMLRQIALKCLLPYVVLSLITLLRLAIQLRWMGTATSEMIRNGILDTLVLYGVKSLWVVSVLAFSLLCYVIMRKDFSYRICLIITIVLAVAAYFTKGMADYIADGEYTAQTAIIKIAFLICRTSACLVYIAAGEGLERQLDKMAPNRLILGLLGILLMVAGVCGTYYLGDSFVDLGTMSLDKPYVYYFAAWSFVLGIYLFSRWIGTLGPLEKIGKEWVILYPMLTCGGFVGVANVVSQNALESLQNRFVAATLGLLVLGILELLTLYLLNGIKTLHKQTDQSDS
ncbi:MAG: hypothetical protein ACI4DU_06270 [Lachnospiraceae bacterium]